MKRKLLSIFLAFAMSVSLLTVGASAVEPTYGDIAGHWAEASIERWSGHGIIQGNNGKFNPNGQLTCAHFAAILARLLKLPAAKDAGFSDNTPDAWHYDAINRCAAAGILKGNLNGTVTPNAPITRERAMVMLGRALGIEPIESPDLTQFADGAQVASYARGMLAALIRAGIVGGVTADQLAPQNNITRAATVTILDRAIGTYADKAGETVNANGKGIVLVVADDVTVTGEVNKLLVPANDIEVTVKGSKNIDDITVSGDNSKVILDNASADNVTLDGEKSAVETKNGAKIDNVIMSENASGATVDVGSGTTVGNVENHAEDATVTGSGTVKKVESDKDITVKTKDTDVKNIGDEKITVTDKSGKDTTVGTTGSGSSTTVNKGTTSSGGGGGSYTPPAQHTHNYVYSTNWDTLASTKKCSNNDSTETIEGIYYIANDVELGMFRDWVNGTNGKTATDFAGKTVKLMADINLENEEWTPIGTSTNPFKGVFDGNGKTISNYQIIAADSNGSGLFGVIAGNENSNFRQLSDVVSEDGTFSTTKISEDKYTCVVKNLNVSNATVTAGEKKYVSPVIGAASNAYIANINVTGTTMTVFKYGAGIVAKLNKGVVNNCATGGTFTGSGEGAGGHIAGIVANVSQDAPFVVMNCTNNASITANYGRNGGIVALSDSGVVAFNCVNNGSITVNNAHNAAGIAGQAPSGDYISCINNGVLSGSVRSSDCEGFGGIAAYASGTSRFFNCENKEDITATGGSFVGGICGKTSPASQFTNCRNNASVTWRGDGAGYAYPITAGVIGTEEAAEMTFAELKNAVEKSNKQKIVIKNITISDTDNPDILVLPANCTNIESTNAICSGMNLQNCTGNVSINVPGTYELTHCPTNDITVVSNAQVTVKDTTNGGVFKIIGSNAGLTISKGCTIARVEFNGTGTYTLTNNGTIKNSNYHVVTTESACNLTVTNNGTINTDNSEKYAMLFYGNSTVVVDQKGTVSASDGKTIIAWNGEGQKAASAIYRVYEDGALTKSWQIAANPWQELSSSPEEP